MKLSTLKISELNSLLNVTEKYIEYIVRDMRLVEKYNAVKYTELRNMHNKIITKHKMILQEINKRIIDIEDEKDI